MDGPSGISDAAADSEPDTASSLDAESECSGTALDPGTHDFWYGGAAYRYVVHLPPSYDGTRRTPVILNWHSFLASAEKEEAWTVMDPVADEEGYIVVYPDSPDGTWNAGTCCAFDAKLRDDVGFARALVDEITRNGCIDTHRIYSTGMSNGGFMSYRLACDAADLFAAVAPVAAKVGIRDCAPSRAVPVLHFHGTADSIVPYDSGVFSGERATVPETVHGWADHDGCLGDPSESYRNGSVTCETWSGCRDGTKVTLCTAQGGQHCWPGNPRCFFDPPTTDIDANRVMMAFFRQFTLP